MAEVTLNNVRKEFGDVVAVDNIPLEVQDGELLVLLGPSGCGKSTTLRLIGGLEFPTDGRIHVSGDDVTDVAPHNRDIAMVFQDLALYPHKSVRDNMSFGLKMRDEPDDTINESVERAAKMLQISDLLDRSPENLSGGQQQRVAIGRAIVRDPQVFLFDEPLSDLDAKLRSALRTEILELHQELKATMVYVTHDQEEAMTLGDRIAVMNDGKLHQLGTPETIYNKPSDLFVATFIGNPDMNFIDGNITTSNGEHHIETDIFEFDIDGNMFENNVPNDGDIRIGIRPESFYSSSSKIQSDGDKVNVAGEVEIVENLGDEYHIHFHSSGKSLVASVDQTNKNVGENINFVADVEGFHYFNPYSEERITEFDDRFEKQPEKPQST